MDKLPSPTRPAPRRDIKAVTETANEVAVGDLVVATFRTPRYGTFKIKGVTVLMLDKKSLVVGSWAIKVDGKPAKALQALTITAESGDHEDAIVPGSDAPEHHGS